MKKAIILLASLCSILLCIGYSYSTYTTNTITATDGSFLYASGTVDNDGGVIIFPTSITNIVIANDGSSDGTSTLYFKDGTTDATTSSATVYDGELVEDPLFRSTKLFLRASNGDTITYRVWGKK